MDDRCLPAAGRDALGHDFGAILERIELLTRGE